MQVGVTASCWSQKRASQDPKAVQLPGVAMIVVQTPSKRRLVLASILLASFMAAIEGTIVLTAVPSIVAELGGFKHYTGVFSAFLLAQTITTVIYGNVADLFGRKRTLIVG